MKNKCEHCGEDFKVRNKWQRFCCRQCFLANCDLKKRSCIYCSKLFSPKKRDAKYCCKECYILDKQKPTKLCPSCHKMFKPQSKKTVYCCNECRYEGQKLTDEEKTIICPGCKQPFIKKKAAQKYCCKSCASFWLRTEERRQEITQRKKAICPYCKKEFIKWNKNSKYCSPPCAHRALSHGQSRENRIFGKLLTKLWFKRTDEFFLWWYFYDFKIWNTLIELNPTAYHNSTFVPPRHLAKPKEKMYHYDKYKCAIKRWYKCIMVRDWTSNLIEMIMDPQFHYEWQPQLNYYNRKTGERIIDNWFNRDEMIDKWFVEIRDCGKEVFTYSLHWDAS